MELFFEVNNQKMERMDVEDPVNSSQEYLKLSFDFKTDDWEDTTKFVFFRVHHINYSYPLTDDSILVPAVFLNSKHLDFGVYGVGGEDYRITTNSLRIKFRESKFWSLSDAPLSVTELIDKLFDEKADLTYVDIELADKVDKVDGKELSSNDFTDEYQPCCCGGREHTPCTSRGRDGRHTAGYAGRWDGQHTAGYAGRRDGRHTAGYAGRRDGRYASGNARRRIFQRRPDLYGRRGNHGIRNSGRSDLCIGNGR